MNQPADDYDPVRDMWGSWWLAHEVIGEQVKAGERELPALFLPSVRETEE